MHGSEPGSSDAGPSIGWGLLAFFGLPILAIVALVTIVGIPLGLGVLAALALIYSLGYTATAWIIGRRILRPGTLWVLAFGPGWGILRVLALDPRRRGSDLVRCRGLRARRAGGDDLAGPLHQAGRPRVTRAAVRRALWCGG